MTVFKATYTIVVLGEFDSERDAERQLTAVELRQMASAIEDGDWIGDFGCQSVMPVEPDKVKDELIAIGNDGTFFGGLDDAE